MSPFATKAPRLDQMPKIKFGKQKGAFIHELDDGYLLWLMKKNAADGSFADHAQWFVDELASRAIPWIGPVNLEPATDQPDKAPKGQGSAKLLLTAELRNLMKSCYGEMSKRYHPDRGGRDGQQAVVIDYHRTLMDALETWEETK
jgi:hypothetical protein